MRVVLGPVVEQVDDKVRLAVAVVVVADAVEEPVVVGVLVLNQLADLLRAGGRGIAERGMAAPVLGMLIDRPRAALSAEEVELAVPRADVQFSAAGVVIVALA